jgi:hypothetical protein
MFVVAILALMFVLIGATVVMLRRVRAFPLPTVVGDRHARADRSVGRIARWADVASLGTRYVPRGGTFVVYWLKG